jgi:hypothetical protein
MLAVDERSHATRNANIPPAENPAISPRARSIGSS